MGVGEKKLRRNKSKPLQIPCFKSTARESKIHLLCPLTTVQNVKFLTQVNTQQNTGKPKKKKKLLHSRITRGLGQLYSLVGFGRPLFEGGGINNPAGSLESGELLGVSVMEEISKQGGESSLLHQKKVEGL